MRRALVVLLSLSALGFGCAQLKSDKTVCEEYRGIRCASRTECSMDQSRGCQVCQCGAAVYGPSLAPQQMLPPDRR